MSQLLKKVDAIEPEIREIWKTIHANPELGLELYETAQLIESELRKHTGVDRIHRVGKSGIWAELKGTKPGDGSNILMLRGDMDALPIQEATGLPYASKNPGKMHACGHDVHASSLLGAVRVLEQYRDQIDGSIWFFFQPGEEVLGGALEFLKDPEIDFSKVKACGACHVLGFNEVGKVNLRDGAHLASPDEISFTVSGRSAHSSTPDATVDAIVIAANLITQLQCMVSREMNPTDSVILTLGKINGGKTAGSVADEVVIEGGLRTINPATRLRLLDRIQQICDGLSLATRSTITFRWNNRAPALHNDHGMFEIAAAGVRKALGEDALVFADTYAMASEDFAFFTQHCPGIHMSIGCRTPGRAPVVAHTPEFYTDEGTVRTAIATYCAFALEYFGVDF